MRAFFVMLAVLLLGALGGCGGDDDAPSGTAPLPSGTIARIEVSPLGALFVPGADNHAFTASAFDAQGNRVAAAFTWSSNAPDVISVDGEGKAKSLRPTGSALVTAEAGGVKATVFAVAAAPPPGTVVLKDDQISAFPSAVDPTASFGPGFRYRVNLVGEVNAPVGAIALSTETKTVAGRIVSTEGSAVVVEQLTIAEVLPKLDIKQRLDLSAATSGEPTLKTQSLSGGGMLRPLVEKDFKVGKLECHVEGSLGALEMTKQDVALAPLQDLFYDIVWDDTAKKIVVTGKPNVTFELEARAKGQLEGKVDCKVMLKDYVIPLPGPLGLFLGAAVPLGLGFEASAKAVIDEVGVNLKGNASAKVAMGFTCNGAGEACTGVTDAEFDGNVTPRLIPPQLDLLDTRIEPEAQVYAWLKFEGGARFDSTLRFEAIEAQAGVKVTGTFAGEPAQAKLDDYSSKYETGIALAAGPSGAADTFLRLAKVAVSLLQFSKEIPLGASPAGTSLVADASSFKTGDEVKFTLKLDPASTKFPVVGYNVDSVRIYRKDTSAGGGALSLVLANEVLPQGEQTEFVIPWVATVDGSVGSSFVAFVRTKVLDHRLEVATSKSSGGPGEIILPDGTKLEVTDSLRYDDDDGPGGQPTGFTYVHFSTKPSGYLQCLKFEQKADSMRGLIIFTHAPGGLTAGTYTVGGELGQFSLSVANVGPTPNCSESNAGVFFDSGTAVVTVGNPVTATLSLHEFNSGKTVTGFTEIPSCVKTREQLTSGALACVP